MLLSTPEDTPPLFDLFLITAKMHIYYCKFKGIFPNLDGFIRRVNNIKCIEKYIALKKQQNKIAIKNGLLQMMRLTLLRNQHTEETDDL